MARKYTDPFGNTPKVKVSLSEARKRILTLDDWFVEYCNVDTRNALSQALELVDHEGDTIFYSGEKHGFKVTFDKVLFLVNSRHNGVFKFTVYHKKPSAKTWSKWEEHKKTPK
jgi:hypothetical protein